MQGKEEFEEWFYQTQNEDRPVVWFDKLVSEYHSSVERWVRDAYCAGYTKGLKVREENNYE